MELLALAKLVDDPVRSAIDDALSLALGFPSMKSLRQLLAREPGLTDEILSPKREQMEDGPIEDFSPRLRLF
jgi:hypothetical protein